MGKIGAVHIPSYGILRNINPQQRIIVLLDRRYRFLAHIRGNGCGYVFLEAVGTHGIADNDKLQYLFLRIAFSGYKGGSVIRIRPFANTIIGGHKIYHILRRGIFFLFLQAVNGSMSVNIRQETKQLRIRHAEGILPVFI